jgi:hypothetical protein
MKQDREFSRRVRHKRNARAQQASQAQTQRKSSAGESSTNATQELNRRVKHKREAGAQLPTLRLASLALSKRIVVMRSPGPEITASGRVDLMTSLLASKNASFSLLADVDIAHFHKALVAAASVSFTALVALNMVRFACFIASTNSYSSAL